MQKFAESMREQILRVAANLARDGGIASVTFDAIAARLHVTKQAVIYWFPRKESLLRDMALPAFAAEAESAITAMAARPIGKSALTAALCNLANFHRQDLDRFRLMYLTPQVGPRPARGGSGMPGSLIADVHPITHRLYSQMAKHWRTHRAELDAAAARRSAMTSHMAVLGYVLMLALTDAVGDPPAHTPEDLLATLVERLLG